MACECNGMVGCPGFNRGAGQVVVLELAAVAGITSLLVACEGNGMVGCPGFNWGAGQVVVLELAAVAGTTSLLRSFRASCV